jgi:acyl-ACP thioesterase
VELIYQKNIKIEPAQCEENNYLTLSSLLDFLQTIAGKHADILHFGITDLNRENDTWVLSRLRVDIDRWPHQGEELILKTWPKGVDRLFAVRDFMLYDMLGNVIVRAASYWLVIDKKTKRPKMMSNIFTALDYPLLSAIDNKLGKTPALQHPEYSSEIMVSENEIDINGHVNNIWYADWIMKVLPNSIKEEKKITSFEINYLSEVLVNETIKIELGRSDNNKNLMLGSLIRGDREVCRVKISFE